MRTSVLVSALILPFSSEFPDLSHLLTAFVCRSLFRLSSIRREQLSRVCTEMLLVPFCLHLFLLISSSLWIPSSLLSLFAHPYSLFGSSALWLYCLGLPLIVTKVLSGVFLSGSGPISMVVAWLLSWRGSSGRRRRLSPSWRLFLGARTRPSVSRSYGWVSGGFGFLIFPFAH